MERGSQDALLITTKLAIPPHYLKEIIPRTHAYAQLDAGLKRPLLLIAAPAGFGKTTLVSTWICQRQLSAAWVSLEQADNENVRFWRYLLTSLQQVHPPIEAIVASWQSSAQPPQIEAILTQLINTLMVLTEEIVLVLDDYHTISNVEIHHALTFLLEHLPPHLHMVIITRHNPPLPLARFHVQGKLTEVRTADLRLTHEETQQFLAQVVHLDLQTEEILEIRKRTEGWVAGLQLMSLALQGKETASARTRTIKAFTGIHRNVLNYLTDEVFNQQSAEVQDFLLKTCVLERLNAALCDAVTGQSNGEMMLEWLDQNNLFLNALDSQQHWYRYDRLFLELLRYRLKQKYGPLLSTLHRLAGQWYEQQNMIVDAIQHIIAAEDVEHAAELIEQNAWEFVQQGKEHLMHTWLIRLPEQSFVSRPMLSLLQAYTLFFQASLDTYEHALLRAERQWQQEQNTIMLSCVYDVRASIALYRFQGCEASTYAQRALSLISEEEAPLFYSSAVVHLGAGYLAQGELLLAAQYLTEGYRLSQKHCYNPVTFMAAMYLGNLQKAQGNLRAALQTYQLIRPEKKSMSNWYHIAAQLQIADIYREWNDLSNAQEHSHQAQQLTEYTYNEGIVMPLRHLLMAQLDWLQERPEQALTCLDQAEHSSQRFGPSPYFLALIAEVRTRFLLSQGDHATAQQWQAQYAPTLLESRPAMEREAWVKARARLLIDQDQSKVAIQLLETAYRLAHKQERIDSEISLLILLTLAYHTEGNTQSTLQKLEQALILAQPGGYTRVFVDEGILMAALLTELYGRYQRRASTEPSTISLGYLYTLLTNFGTEVQPPRWLVSQGNEDTLIDKLSEREYMVLGLIAEGLSNQEIAHKLVVTVSTIKTHLNNIYAKLHVHTRLQAVTRAYDLGVLRRCEIETEPLAHPKPTERQ